MSFKNVAALLMFIWILSENSIAQMKTENVILITIDGLRWQELFTGANPALLKSKRYVSDAKAIELFNAKEPNLRRQKLFPFLWSTISHEGQIYGNRNYGNKVNVANRYWFSYPGYNELLTGNPDKRIRSNAKKVNPNETILAYANKQTFFRNKVAAFASWDLFHYIVDSKRSQIYINAGDDTASQRLTSREKYLNHLQRNTRSPWKATRFDKFTHSYAKEYLKKNYPRLVLIAYGETDEFAHQRKYDEYLQAARNTDEYIREIWDFVQGTEFYRNKTTLIITTDHGRGRGKHSWRSHGIGRVGSNHTWFAIMGPDTQHLGELQTKEHYYTNQIAKMVASLLMLDYPKHSSEIPAILTAVADQ